MFKVKNIAEASKDDQKKFIESFDTVLLDIDGVIWIYGNPIRGAVECISNLKQIGKNVHYVTNTTLLTEETFLQHLHKRNFIADISDIINPTQTLVHCLKKLDVKDDIFILGMHTIKSKLKENGFTLVPDPPALIQEQVNSVISHYDEGKVGAVIFDLDFNLNFLKMQKAFWYLRDNPQCVFLVLSREKGSPIGSKGPLLGNYHFVEALQEISGKNYIDIGKPSLTMVNHIKKTYKITEPNRVLFVGDTIQSDLGTATLGSFQKLLVLSGTSKIEDINDWQYPDDYKPEYYAEDLGVLNDIIKNVYKSK